jgi:hypothetical protein
MAAGQVSATLSRIYGYADNRAPDSFGWLSNCSSVLSGLGSLEAQQRACPGQVDVDTMADAIHEGWALAARQTWDTGKYGPQQQDARTPAGLFAAACFATPDGERP